MNGSWSFITIASGKSTVADVMINWPVVAIFVQDGPFRACPHSRRLQDQLLCPADSPMTNLKIQLLGEESGEWHRYWMFYLTSFPSPSHLDDFRLLRCSDGASASLSGLLKPLITWSLYIWIQNSQYKYLVGATEDSWLLLFASEWSSTFWVSFDFELLALFAFFFAFFFACFFFEGFDFFFGCVTGA